jgi:cytochrome P450
VIRRPATFRGGNPHPGIDEARRATRKCTVTTTATDSDLVFDPYDHSIMVDPHALFRRMREEAPLYYNPEHDFYAVSRFEDVEKVLLTRDVFISRKGVTLGLLKSDWEIPAGTLIFDEPPVHGIHRSLLSRMFTPRRVAELEPKIRQLCGELLDPYVGGDGFDFVRDLGSIVPMQVISMLLGIPEEEQVRIRDHFAYTREEQDSAEMEPDAHSLDGGIFAEFIDWRVDHPTDDIMSRLLHAEFEDENGVTRKLSRDELLCYINIVAAAGNETTRILIGWTGKLLADHPDQRRKVAEDLSLSGPAIEEILRCEPNTLTNCRWSVSDFEFHGQVVPAESIMVTLTASAGRDDRVYPDSDRFDVTRKPGMHMYFGFGAHYCLGQALARLEGRIVLEEVLKRFPEWDVDLANSRFMYHTDNRGYSSLPIVLP